MLMNYARVCNPYSGFSAPVNATSAIESAEKALFSGLSRHVSHYGLRIKDGRKIDPAMGSGHTLIYMFEVLMQIYKSAGYAERDAAISILEHNIYGLDIDDRAFQLSYFALIMKARQYNRTILRKKQNVHVYAIQESNDINYDHLKFIGNTFPESEKKESSRELKRLLGNFKDAKIYGSIIKVNGYDFNTLKNLLRATDTEGQISAETLGLDETIAKIREIVGIADVMQSTYMTIITNLSYMGSGNMGTKLSEYVKHYYPDSKADLFSVFIECCEQMTRKSCYQAMITQHAWMFLGSFEKLRKDLLNITIVNMVHLGARAFEEISGEVVQTTSFVLRKAVGNKYKGVYCRLIEGGTQKAKEDLFLNGENRYMFLQNNFSRIPGTPMAYWISKKYINIFGNLQMKDYGSSCIGMRTGDNERFLRIWQEVSFKKVGLGYSSPKDANNSHKSGFHIVREVRLENGMEIMII